MYGATAWHANQWMVRWLLHWCDLQQGFAVWTQGSHVIHVITVIFRPDRDLHFPHLLGEAELKIWLNVEFDLFRVFQTKWWWNLPKYFQRVNIILINPANHTGADHTMTSFLSERKLTSMSSLFSQNCIVLITWILITIPRSSANPWIMMV